MSKINDIIIDKYTTANTATTTTTTVALHHPVTTEKSYNSSITMTTTTDSSQQKQQQPQQIILDSVDCIKKKLCIIIPGIGGSKLYCTCDKLKKPIKIYPVVTGNLSKHFFDSNCKLVTKPFRHLYGISVYKNLEKRLLKHNVNAANPTDVEYFSYDWRKSPIQIARELQYHLTRKDLYERKKILVGHSNGGFIIRILFEYLHFPLDFIEHAFICGTPFYGSIDKSLYYNEMKIYNKLHDNKLEAPIKLMCLSGDDVNKIFKVYKETLLYFIPSFIFECFNCISISEYSGVDVSQVVIAKQVHRQLGKFNINKCVFYYNISTKKTIERIVEESDIKRIYFHITPRASGISKEKSGNYKISEKVFTDNLIIPSVTFPINSTFIFDTFNLNHGLIMNSRYLYRIIKTLIDSNNTNNTLFGGSRSSSSSIFTTKN